MDFNFVEKIGEFDAQQKTYFYQLLAVFTSDSMRGILFMDGISDEERVERAKWLNEIAYRITYKIFWIQKGKSEFYSEEEIWNIVLQNAEKHPKTLEDVNSAIELSYKYVLENESDKAQVTTA